MSGSYTYQWPRPALTVDTVIVSKATDAAPSQILLIQRKHPPCKGQWALPGGFVDEKEPLSKAAARELQEETSVNPADADLFQVGSYGDPGRDPRGWTVTVAYAAVVPSTELGVKAADDAAAAHWFPVESPPSLAFDHKLIIREAFDTLSSRPEVAGNGPMVQQLKAATKAAAEQAAADSANQAMSAMLQPLLLTLLGAAGTGLGGLLVVLQPQMCFKRLGALQGLAAGLMLSISLIDLLPEAVEEIGFIPANLCFYAGVLFFAAIVALIPEPDAMFAAAAGDHQQQHQQQRRRHSQQPSFPLSVKLSSEQQQPASTPLAPKTPVPTSAQQPAPYAYDLTQPGGSSSSEGRDQGTIRRRSNAAGASLAPSAARLETSAGGMQPADPPTQQQQQQVSASPRSPASSCGCSTDLAVLLNEDGSGSGGGSSSTEEDRRHKRQLLMSGLITAVGIALHNFPEGIAVLLASQKSTAVGVSLAAAIGLHNVPEGVAVALPVYFATGSRWRGLQTAVLSGLAEPLAVVLLGLLLPFMQLNKHVVDGMLAGVGGIMAFLAFHELLPLSMQHAGRPLAVGCLFGGMGLMSLTLHYLNTHVLADLH